MLLIAWMESCVSHDFPESQCVQAYSFAEDIQPIVESKCAISGCHNGDIGQNLNWTDFEMFHQRAVSGEVKRRVINRVMPPPGSHGGALTEEQINAITCWTDQGALNN